MIFALKVAVKWLALLLRILEVPGSHFCSRTPALIILHCEILGSHGGENEDDMTSGMMLRVGP
jgi:hypothetical protein